MEKTVKNSSHFFHTNSYVYEKFKLEYFDNEKIFFSSVKSIWFIFKSTLIWAQLTLDPPIALAYWPVGQNSGTGSPRRGPDSCMSQIRVAEKQKLFKVWYNRGASPSTRHCYIHTYIHIPVSSTWVLLWMSSPHTYDLIDPVFQGGDRAFENIGY